MTWPLTPELGSKIGLDIGDPLFQAWQVAWVGHALVHQPLHVFQSNAFWPLRDSLAFSDALVGYAPAGAAAGGGPHSTLVVYNLLFLFAYALAFFGACLLARELGAGPLGAAAAGIGFAFAPWRLVQSGHLHVLSSGGIPLSLFLLVRGYRRRSAGLVLVGWLVAAWQMLLGFSLGLQLAYLLGILATIAAVIWLRRGRTSLERGLVLTSLVGVLAFGAVTSFQARPYLRVIHDHPEAKRKQADVATYSPPLRGFVAAPKASLIWSGATKASRDALRYGANEKTLFPGATVSVLALIGLLGATYPRRLRIGLGLAVLICAALSLGLRQPAGPRRYLAPYRLLYDFAPGWDGIRTPGRINTLTSLGLALLAAAGLCVILRAIRPVAARLAVALVLLGAVLVEGLGPLPLAKVPFAPAGQQLATPPELHLPSSPLIDARYSFWSTDGFPAIVNGYGAFEPTFLLRLHRKVARFPDPASVRALQKLGVRTVVLHPDLAFGTSWEDASGRPVAGLPLTRQAVGDVVLFRLAPASRG